MSAKQAKPDLLQRPLDLLILRIIAPGPVHGYDTETASWHRLAGAVASILRMTAAGAE
jgi:hypothetical protein